MKVRLTVDLDDRDRYVIAKYFGVTSARATRKQAKEFVQGAVRTAVREQGSALRSRQRSTVKRLETARDEVVAPPELRQPREKQLSLLNGAK